ncbi:hypothetical protein [Rhizobium sp. Root708]|nr:hypothetical protein [Rhizobium sp. Root708]
MAMTAATVRSIDGVGARYEGRRSPSSKYSGDHNSIYSSDLSEILKVVW